MSFGWNVPPTEGLRGLGLLTLPITVGKHPDDYTRSPVVVKRKVFKPGSVDLTEGRCRPRSRTSWAEPLPPVCCNGAKGICRAGREHGASGM